MEKVFRGKVRLIEQETKKRENGGHSTSVETLSHSISVRTRYAESPVSRPDLPSPVGRPDLPSPSNLASPDGSKKSNELSKVQRLKKRLQHSFSKLGLKSFPMLFYYSLPLDKNSKVQSNSYSFGRERESLCMCGVNKKDRKTWEGERKIEIDIQRLETRTIWDTKM